MRVETHMTRDRKTENVIAQIAVLSTGTSGLCGKLARRFCPHAYFLCERVRFRLYPRVDFRSWVNKGISFAALGTVSAILQIFFAVRSASIILTGEDQ